MLAFKTMGRSAVVTLLAVGLAACSEGPTTAPSPMFDAPDALMAKGSNGSGSGSKGSESGGRGKDSGERTFTIWPAFPVFEKFGDHSLVMPANVVCDPATSGYGTAYWELPCARAKAPIQVTAKWGTRGGRAVISFSPDLRFVPSNHESQWVNLTLRDPKTINPELYYTILWFDKEAGRWVDESQTDPTLTARISSNGNFVTRRLKHFSELALWSGYNNYFVTSGLGGDDALGLGNW